MIFVLLMQRLNHSPIVFAAGLDGDQSRESLALAGEFANQEVAADLLLAVLLRRRLIGPHHLGDVIPELVQGEPLHQVLDPRSQPPFLVFRILQAGLFENVIDRDLTNIDPRIREIVLVRFGIEDIAQHGQVGRFAGPGQADDEIEGIRLAARVFDQVILDELVGFPDVAAGADHLGFHADGRRFRSRRLVGSFSGLDRRDRDWLLGRISP